MSSTLAQGARSIRAARTSCVTHNGITRFCLAFTDRRCTLLGLSGEY